MSNILALQALQTTEERGGCISLLSIVINDQDAGA